MIPLHSTVKIKHPIKVTDERGREHLLPAERQGKVVKVHADYDPPCWFTVEFGTPSGIVSLHIGSLILVNADGTETDGMVLARPHAPPKPVKAKRTRTVKEKTAASESVAEPLSDDEDAVDPEELKAFLARRRSGE